MDARTLRRLRREVFKAKKDQAEKELALNNLLLKVYDEVLCGCGWYDDGVWDFMTREQRAAEEAEWKQYTIGATKQLLKNGVGLPDKVKKYYTTYAVVRDSLKNDWKDCPENNPLFKYEVMKNVKKTVEKMDEFQKELDELCPKKCSLYYKSDEYYNKIMTDLEDYEQHWLSNWCQCDPYYHREYSVKKNGDWNWKAGYMECEPILNWLAEQK